MSSAGTTVGMSDTKQPGFMRRYRLPIFLGLLALALYGFSIVWIIFGRGMAA